MFRGHVARAGSCVVHMTDGGLRVPSLRTPGEGQGGGPFARRTSVVTPRQLPEEPPPQPSPGVPGEGALRPRVVIRTEQLKARTTFGRTTPDYARPLTLTLSPEYRGEGTEPGDG